MQSTVVIGATARRPHYWFAAFICMAVIAASLVAVIAAAA
jgi:hypothetical protein